MRHSFVFRDWKSWVSIVGLTALTLLFGIGEFQQAMPFWLFTLLFLVINWLCYGIVHWFFHQKSWNHQQLLYSSRHLTFCLLSSLIVLSFSQIEANYRVAYFAGFVLIGVVFSAFEYVLLALDELTAFKLPNTSRESLTSEILPRFELMNTKGKVSFSVNLPDIVCFEANDNYLTIYYVENEKLYKQMERLSMRKAEEMTEALNDVFLRVHKSFLVNRSFITAISGKAQHHKLNVSHMEFEIPVSRRVNIREMLPNL